MHGVKAYAFVVCVGESAQAPVWDYICFRDRMCMCVCLCLPAWHWYVYEKVYAVLVQSQSVCEWVREPSLCRNHVSWDLHEQVFFSETSYMPVLLSLSFSLSHTLTGKIKFVISLLKNQLERKIKYWHFTCTTQISLLNLPHSWSSLSRAQSQLNIAKFRDGFKASRQMQEVRSSSLRLDYTLDWGNVIMYSTRPLLLCFILSKKFGSSRNKGSKK